MAVCSVATKWKVSAWRCSEMAKQQRSFANWAFTMFKLNPGQKSWYAGTLFTLKVTLKPFPGISGLALSGLIVHWVKTMYPYVIKMHDAAWPFLVLLKCFDSRLDPAGWFWHSSRLEERRTELWPQHLYHTCTRFYTCTLCTHTQARTALELKHAEFLLVSRTPVCVCVCLDRMQLSKYHWHFFVCMRVCLCKCAF